MAIRRAQDPDQRQARASVDLGSRLKELQASIVATVLPIVQGSADRITALLNNYLLKTDATNTYSPIGHKHAASDITSGGTTGTGFTVGGTLGVNGDLNPTGAVAAGGQVSGTQAVFPTGVRSTGAYNNQLTSNYRAMYIDANGNQGYAPSTRASKDVGQPYAVNMQAFLATTLFNWQYKDDGMHGIGPLADDLDAAGLTEFVMYDDDGAPAGLRIETLVIGLWSAYVQSRANTLARVANQMLQTVTNGSMTALGVNAEKTYTVVWPKAFADTNYAVIPSVTSSGAALAAVAYEVPGSKTNTQVQITVRTLGVALLANSTLTVNGIHI